MVLCPLPKHIPACRSELKPEEGSYGHISEGFILAEFYLLRVSIQNLGEWLTCDLALQVNFLYV